MTQPTEYEQMTYNSPTGAQAGKASTEKVAFLGATPTSQLAAITAVGTSVPVAACASFGLTSTQLSALVTATNSLITALQNFGLTA